MTDVRQHSRDHHTVEAGQYTCDPVLVTLNEWIHRRGSMSNRLKSGQNTTNSWFRLRRVRVTVDYSDSNASVEVYLDAGEIFGIDLEEAIVSGGHAEGDKISDFENIRGSEYGDYLEGDSNANRIEGGGGDDRMRGHGGADVFVFAPGHGTDFILDFTDSGGENIAEDRIN